MIFNHDEYGADETVWTPEEEMVQRYHEYKTASLVEWAAELASYGLTEEEIQEIIGVEEQNG